MVGIGTFAGWSIDLVADDRTGGGWVRDGKIGRLLDDETDV